MMFVVGSDVCFERWGKLTACDLKVNNRTPPEVIRADTCKYRRDMQRVV